MPDSAGNFKGVALNGKASETWERVFGGAAHAPGDIPEGPAILTTPDIKRRYDAMVERHFRPVPDPAPPRPRPRPQVDGGKNYG